MTIAEVIHLSLAVSGQQYNTWADQFHPNNQAEVKVLIETIDSVWIGAWLLCQNVCASVRVCVCVCLRKRDTPIRSSQQTQGRKTQNVYFYIYSIYCIYIYKWSEIEGQRATLSWTLHKAGSTHTVHFTNVFAYIYIYINIYNVYKYIRYMDIFWANKPQLIKNKYWDTGRITPTQSGYKYFFNESHTERVCKRLLIHLVLYCNLSHIHTQKHSLINYQDSKVQQINTTYSAQCTKAKRLAHTYVNRLGVWFKRCVCG